MTDTRLLLLSPRDNVFVLRGAIEAGETIMVSGVQVSFEARIGLGHKVARSAILAATKVLKYGAPIGSATRDIDIGEHVHIANLKSDYTATHSLEEAKTEYAIGLKGRET
ncbi:MAG: hypothetical protein COA47_04990 [Robiginitomaculum sp.]|nr:MAG: hypothetical protein COA47_04990 [Robiginitomaculum sp.]